MEDLWNIQNSGIEIEEFADIAEYKRFLKRFGKDEEETEWGRVKLTSHNHLKYT